MKLTTLEKTLIAFVGGYLGCKLFGETERTCVTSALICGFVPAYLEGLHIQIKELLRHGR